MFHKHFLKFKRLMNLYLFLKHFQICIDGILQMQIDEVNKQFNESLVVSLLVMYWAFVFVVRITCKTKISMLKSISFFKEKLGR